MAENETRVLEQKELRGMNKAVEVSKWLSLALGYSGNSSAISREQLGALEAMKSWAIDLNYTLLLGLRGGQGEFKGLSWFPSGPGIVTGVESVYREFLRKLCLGNPGRKLNLEIREEDASKNVPVMEDEGRGWGRLVRNEFFPTPIDDLVICNRVWKDKGGNEVAIPGIVSKDVAQILVAKTQAGR